MIKYNFLTKEYSHVFDEVKYLVNNCALVDIKATKEEAVIVELFDKLFIAAPIEAIGEIVVGGWNTETTGFMFRKGIRVYFSIHGEVMYLRAGM